MSQLKMAMEGEIDSRRLVDIVSRNANTEIGKRWNFSAIKSVGDFRSNVPLTDYEVYRPYIQRMIDGGETDLIACGDVAFFCPTSGTTSKSKIIPAYSSFKPEYWKHAMEEGKTAIFTTLYKTTVTPHGKPIMPASVDSLGSLLSVQPYTYPAPFNAYTITDMRAAFYIQMVFTLKIAPLNTTAIISLFISVLLTAFNVLTKDWQEIVADIRNGTLNASLKLTPDDRESLEQAMGGSDAVRANELEVIFESASASNFKGVVSQLWPNVKLVSAICGGEFRHYIPRLQFFLGEAVTICSPFYGCSESLLAINKWPYKRTSAYALVTELLFYEFIPLEQVGKPNPDVLLSNEVKVGEFYEIVITTGEGLYRYRFGDIITVLEISAEYGPVIDVVGRSKMIVDLNGIWLYSFQVTGAIDAFIKHVNKQSTDVDFLMSADTTVVPPRCVIWLECGDDDLHATAAAIIEEHLKRTNDWYVRCMKRGAIGRLAVKQLKPGTIAHLKLNLKQQSKVGESQMKLPRVVWDMALLGLLEKSTVDCN